MTRVRAPRKKKKRGRSPRYTELTTPSQAAPDGLKVTLNRCVPEGQSGLGNGDGAALGEGCGASEGAAVEGDREGAKEGAGTGAALGAAEGSLVVGVDEGPAVVGGAVPTKVGFGVVGAAVVGSEDGTAVVGVAVDGLRDSVGTGMGRPVGGRV